VVGRGYLENFELEFRIFPTITKCPGQKVPVVIWAIPMISTDKLDQIEFLNIGVLRKECLKVKIENVTDKGLQDNLPEDEVDALVYIMADESKPL
jgi:hypothetical protein